MIRSRAILQVMQTASLAALSSRSPKLRPRWDFK
jgi:hypothetical protein